RLLAVAIPVIVFWRLPSRSSSSGGCHPGESRRRAPCRLSAAGLSSPLPEPDVRLSLRIRLSRRHGEVRRSHPGETVSVDRGPGEQVLLGGALPPETSRATATTGLIRAEYVTRARFWALLP